MPNPTLDFFFDYSSPFAYLGAVQVEDTAKRCGATLVYRPMLLGALFKEIGTPMVPLHTFPEAKRTYYGNDLKRWAEYRGVDFRFPSKFPMNTVNALRLTLVVMEDAPDAVPDLVGRIYRAFWAEDRDISDLDVLGELCSESGTEKKHLERITEPSIKSSLREATALAIEAGVCGAPCFRVGEMVFWGQDRLELAERALTGWQPACG